MCRKYRYFKNNKYHLKMFKVFKIFFYKNKMEFIKEEMKNHKN